MSGVPRPEGNDLTKRWGWWEALSQRAASKLQLVSNPAPTPPPPTPCLSPPTASFPVRRSQWDDSRKIVRFEQQIVGWSLTWRLSLWIRRETLNPHCNPSERSRVCQGLVLFWNVMSKYGICHVCTSADVRSLTGTNPPADICKTSPRTTTPTCCRVRNSSAFYRRRCGCYKMSDGRCGLGRNDGTDAPD